MIFIEEKNMPLKRDIVSTYSPVVSLYVPKRDMHISSQSNVAIELFAACVDLKWIEIDTSCNSNPILCSTLLANTLMVVHKTDI